MAKHSATNQANTPGVHAKGDQESPTAQELRLGQPLLIDFSLPGQWDAVRYTARDRRRATGATTIRVSKATAAALKRLVDQVKQVHPDRWQWRKLSLDELLEAIAHGVVRLTKPPARKYAKRRSLKSIQTRSSPEHAPNCACDFDEAEGDVIGWDPRCARRFGIQQKHTGAGRARRRRGDAAASEVSGESRRAPLVPEVGSGSATVPASADVTRNRGA